MAHNSQADNSQKFSSFDQLNSSRTQNKSPSSIFKPNKCIILSINKGYATTNNFNQDRIRKEINLMDLMDLIMLQWTNDYRTYHTQYKYNSDFSKACLQLSRSETAKHVISALISDLFGGSSACSAIKYDAVKPTTMCMLKGLPLSTDDINIEKDIERVYNISAKCGDE